MELDNKKILGSTHKVLINWSPVIKVIILALIFCLAFASRIFSVIRYEAIIHEFDPWFNYRTTQLLAREGFYKFFNWFDSESWYPLGRVIGGTVYPGIMSTAAIIYWICQQLLIPIEIRNVCVFIAPFFAGMTALACYLLTKEVTKKSNAGLFAAFFISVVPSYMSRSVAGSYDNEAVSIFALVLTFYLFLKSANTGSILYSIACALSYFYMVASWGGYSFIINIIPIFVLGMMLINRFSSKLYVSYSIFYILGTILAIQIPFVGFQAIKSAEHLSSHGVFVIVQVYVFNEYLHTILSKARMKMLSRILIVVSVVACTVLCLLLVFSGISKWSGRSMTLLDPTYASKFVPIIASVSEHQATTWTSYFFDLQILMILIPIGFFFCCVGQKENTNYGKIFVALYGILSIYFSCVMIRLMLVLAPCACILAAIGASGILDRLTGSIHDYLRKGAKSVALPDLSIVGSLILGFLCFLFLTHSTWTGAEAYSSPSVIMSSRNALGGKEIIDDYREAYYWLRQNTPEDTKIMSWWDSGKMSKYLYHFVFYLIINLIICFDIIIYY